MTMLRHGSAVLVTLLTFATPAVAAPSITFVVPSSGPTSGGTVITITGSGFSASGNSVTVGGGTCTVGPQDTTRVLCATPEGAGAANDVIVTDDTGASSAAANFAYDPPSLTSITPAQGPTSGGTVLTLNGSNFGPAGALRSVAIGSSSTCTDVSGSHTQVTCETSEGQGSSQAVSITVAGQTSGSLPFSYDAPAITSVTPAASSTVGGTPLTINGSNFGTLATAIVGASNCPVETQTHSSIVCTSPAGTPGSKSVLVLVEGQVSNPVPHTYASPPQVLSVLPSSGPTEGNIPITINGVNFTASGNSAHVGGRDCPVTSESTTSVVCSAPEGTGVDRGVLVVTGDGLDSNTALFDYAPPLVTSIEPTHAATSGNIPITIRGENFGPADADAVRSVIVGTSACPLLASASSHTEIQCVLPEGQGVGRTIAVVVDGQVDDATTIDYDPPAIDSVTPADAPTAGNVILTIRGLNFGVAAVVDVGGSICPVTLQSHEELQCNLPPGSGTGLTLLVDVSGQFDSTTFDYRDPSCGDGIADPDEDCDDGDADDLDGCSSACETEVAQDRDQAGCIVALNKAGTGVFKAQTKDVAACARDAEAGVACILDGTASSAVDKARQKVADAETKKCASPPDFGRAPVTVVQDANVAQEIALAVDLFGADPDAALVPDAMAPARAGCQQDVLKAVHKLALARLKAFGKCKKGAFADDAIRAPSQLAACLASIDADDGLAKPTQAVFSTLVDSCLNFSEDLATAFPGVCAEAADVSVCLENRVRCRTCRAIVATDGLDDDCDGYDDGADNASCE